MTAGIDLSKNDKVYASKFPPTYSRRACKEWGYDFVEQLKENNGKQFYNIFCKITKTYFIDRSPGEYYSVEFSKDGKVAIKRCGKDFHKREPDAVIEIQSIVNILIK